MGHALTQNEIEKALEELPGWEYEGDRLKKVFHFSDFVEAFAFMTSVALVAERSDHHPEWKNVYNRVEIELTTHDLGRRVGPKDIGLAAEIEEISGSVNLA
jgi:4a-hydroxytetrahydrobiopterin dehydratase